MALKRSVAELGAIGRNLNQLARLVHQQGEFVRAWPRGMAKKDLAFATVESYRKILESTWRRAIGALIFEEVKYSTLAKIVDAKWAISKKTHNNVVSIIRCAFEYGYRDHPGKMNPASAVKCFRLTKKDRPPPEPFSIHKAEALIAAIHRDGGEAQGNYDEFRFFTGLPLAARYECVTRGMRRELGMVEREGLENALKDKKISNLLICFELKSPSIPFDPPIWHWIWQWN